MNTNMKAYTSSDTHNKIVLFMQQMIPHHNNAVNMAKLLLQQSANDVAAVEDLEDILWEIINVQNYQVHQFRNYLNPKGFLLENVNSQNVNSPSPTPPPPPTSSSFDGVATQAVIGIAIGCAAAGCCVGAGLVYLVLRGKNGNNAKVA